MSELKLISPLLDNFDMGDAISAHDGVRCCPAMKKESDEKYIVKVISIPASRTQLDALLLTGAYPSEEAALEYFKELAADVNEEVQILQRLAKLEGFLPYENCQTVPMDDDVGYHVYLLGTYKHTLEKFLKKDSMTHLSAVNLGLDLCASLAVCRRAGYLYVDLKPSNIFVSNEKEFRIGDLGFVRLNALTYASLPDKYRSQYTAPELADPFASLNTTVDIYAVGLILYQAYNNGVLPEVNADGAIAPPEYADYEMAEIILKACAANPEDRWQDPIQMGQALVSYMQRNGVNDTPIVPVSSVVADEIAEAIESALDEELNISLDEFTEDADVDIDLPEEVSDDVVDIDEMPVIEKSPETEAEVIKESADIYTEDDEENVDFLMDLPDETDPGSISDEIAYSEVSDELNEILAQVDELTAHEIPEPVVAPEPIEVVIPEPIMEVVPEEAEPVVDEETEEEVALPEGFEPLDNEHVDFMADSDESSEPEQETDPLEELDLPPRKKSRGWLVGVIIALALLIVIVAGFLFYRNIYLMPINSIKLEGTEDSLTVLVNADAEDSVLKVVCADSHGNQITLPVINGKATFENLIPNTAYNIKVVTDRFHKLTGNTATAYSTPAQTDIVQFSAVTGAEDGSVILGFTVEGPDAGQWSVVYFAEGEPEQVALFPSHMVTLTGLTVGKEYTFRLVSDTDLYITGTDEIKFVASKLVYAENLLITSFVDGELTISWDTPKDTEVPHWTVRCYNDSDYNETIITSENSVVFESLDHSRNYTVEVTAAGMSVSQRAFVAKNAKTASNFQADHTDPNKLVITWEVSSDGNSDGWLMLYRVDGSTKQASVPCSGNSAVIHGVVPGAVYDFELQDTNGTTVLCEPFSYTAPEAQDFSGYSVTAENMSASLYQAPDLVYTNTFIPSDSIYMKITLNKRPGSSEERITVLFATRNAEGKVINNSSTTLVWSNMWTNRECILAIPYTPEEIGDYDICIYFNGQLVTVQSYNIENAAE